LSTIYSQLINTENRAVQMIPVYLLRMNGKLKALIQLFWQGKLSKDAGRELLSELTDNEQELRRKMESGFGKIPDDEQLHHDDDYQRYLQKIHEKAGCNGIPPQRVRPMWHKWAAAASVLLVVGLGYLARFNKTTQSSVNTYVSQQPAPCDTTIIRNDDVRASTFALKDGSEVTLFPGSRIAYDAHYGDKDRRLQLVGEAKFTVAEDPARPFVVATNGYTTTALGTSFIVDARTMDQVRVRLLTGKVVVSSMPDTRYLIADQYLLPGEELAIQVSLLALKKRSFAKGTPMVTKAPKRQPVEPTERSVSDLHFVDTPLEEVLKQISVSRRVQFDFSNALQQELYCTADFSAEDDLETILDVISTMTGLVYEKQSDNVVTLSRAPVNEKQNNKRVQNK
jgi:transmembrane sensor